MTATMLLQDSILKPSVFRSASGKQSFASQIPVNGETKLLYITTYLKRTQKKRQIWKIHKGSLRLEMILLRMFISSGGLTSMSYGTRVGKVTARRREEHENRQNGGKKRLDNSQTALTSPASCWKTLRNCLSSSLSFCSANTAGRRGGGFTRQSTQLNVTQH